jgi:hypothetical protein
MKGEHHPVAENIQPNGLYRALSLSRDLSPDEIDLARRYLRGERGIKLPILAEYEMYNLVPTVGKNVVARRLAGDTTYTGIINYGAFGSGSTAFASSSTQLNTEVFRKAPTGASFDTNIAYIDWFIATGDVANQTFNEFGAFIDGTASANTGQATSLLTTGGWVKSGALFISLAITIS